MKKSILNYDWTFFWKAIKVFMPIILAGIINALVNFVDNIIVSGSTVHDVVVNNQYLDKIDYTSVGAGNELSFMASSIAVATSVLFTILFSQFAKRKTDFSESFKLSVLFISILSIAIAIILYFLAGDLVGLFFTGKESLSAPYVKEHATNFVQILSYGYIFYALALNLISPLTIKGHVRYGLYLSLISLLLNAILDVVFVYGLSMGAEGSAWATDISFFVQFVLAIILVIKNKQYFSDFLKIFIIHRQIFKETFKRLGIFTLFFLMQSAFAFMTILWSRLYGDDYIRSITTGYILADLLFITFAATTRSVSMYVGPLLGKGKMKEAKIMSKKLLGPNIFIMTSSMIIAAVFTLFFPQLMLNGERYIWIAQWVIIVFIIALPGYFAVTFWSAMFEVGGKQWVPNFWNRGFAIWAQIPLIFVFSHYWLDLQWEWSFLYINLAIYIAGIVIYVLYTKNRWLNKIHIQRDNI